MYLPLLFVSFYTISASWFPFQTILLKDMGYSNTVIGILTGMYSLAGIAGPFIFGHFADAFGRYKPPMLWGHALIFVGLVPLGLFAPPPLLTGLFMLIFSVGFNSVLPLAEAVTTIAIGPGGNYGKVRTPGSVSYILTVLFLQFVPFLKPYHRFPIVFWTVLFAFISFLFYTKIPPRYTDVRRVRQSRAPGPGGSIKSPLLILGLTLVAFSRLAMSGATGFFSLYVVEKLNWDAIGLLNAISATSEIPFLLFSRVLITRFGAVNCLLAGNVGMLVRLILLFLFPSPGGAVAAQMMHSLSYGLFHPAALTFISSCVPPHRRALGMSLYLAIGNTLPGFIGNVSGGIILDHFGFPSLFASFSVFALVSLILCFFLRSPKKGREIRPA